MFWRFPAGMRLHAEGNPERVAAAEIDINKISALANTRCPICDGYGHSGVINKKGKVVVGKCPTEVRLRHYLGASAEGKAAYTAALRYVKTGNSVILRMGKPP